MDIKITRGDTRNFRFQRLNELHQPISTIADNIFFTVKRSYLEKPYVIQKKLSDETITFDTSNYYYYFTIEPEDTNDLYFGSYDYDIQVNANNEKHTLAKGQFILDKEITWADNEVE